MVLKKKRVLLKSATVICISSKQLYTLWGTSCYLWTNWRY